jgi:hypothetical protein
MTDNTSTHSMEHFDAETLKELRENARLYQKLDLAYLAAGGAIVTALKLNNDALLEFSAQQWVVVIAFIILLSADTFIEQFVFSEWIAAKTNASKRRTTRVVKGVIGIQPVLHLIFISGVIASALGFAMGSTSFRDTVRARANIQDATEIFLSTRNRLPNSVEELMASTPNVAHWYDMLQHQPIRLEPDPKEQYRIVFSGLDRTFGTNDDEVVTSLVKLRKFLDATGPKECK